VRVFLVNPIFPPSLWNFAGCRDLEGSRYAHPPLALPTVAALTPRPHVVTCVDENVEAVDLDAPADIVGLTGYYIQRERLFALADAFRARGRRVCIGGPIVEESTLDECLAHADHVFRGEAEYTWPRFFDDLAAGRAERIYRQAELVDLRDSPLPRSELLRLARYSTTTIETSRGCPYSCELCEIPARLGRRAQTKSVAQVMAEVRALHRLGADSIFIVDDRPAAGDPRDSAARAHGARSAPARDRHGRRARGDRVAGADEHPARRDERRRAGRGVSAAGARARRAGALARTARYYLLSSDTRARRMAWRVVREVAGRRPDDLATAIMHLVIYKHLRGARTAPSRCAPAAAPSSSSAPTDRLTGPARVTPLSSRRRRR
jgi:hypothetical protein